MSTPPSLEFEQATINDLSFLTRKTIELHNFETEFSKTSLQTNGNFESEINHWIKEEIDSPNSLIFILKLNSINIGFAFIKILLMPNNFTNHSSYGLIQSIWIDEKHRKENLGFQAVALIESIFKEQGIAYYEVNYESSNTVAEKFWKKCGLIPSSITARKFLT